MLDGPIIDTGVPIMLSQGQVRSHGWGRTTRLFYKSMNDDEARVSEYLLLPHAHLNIFHLMWLALPWLQEYSPTHTS